MSFEIGDIVVIRGDLCTRKDGSCKYHPEQLVNGKYVKHATRNQEWLMKVKRVVDERVNGWADDVVEHFKGFVGCKNHHSCGSESNCIGCSDAPE